MTDGAAGGDTGQGRSAAWQDEFLLVPVRPILTVSATLYALFTVTHALLLPPAERLTLALIAGGTCAVLFGLRLLVARRPPPPALANPIIAVVLLLALLNATIHIAVSGEPHQSTTVMLVLLAAGVFLLSARWLWAVLLSAWASWGVLGVPRVGEDPWGHYTFAILSASVVAVLLHALRVRSVAHVERLRAADATQRHQLEAAVEELRRSEARFRELTAATLEGIVVHEGRRVLDANPAFARMFGYEVAAVRGLDILEFVAPEERETAAARLRDGFEDPQEFVGLHRDGTRFSLEARARTVPWGQASAQVVAVRDVSADRTRERELARALVELRRSNEELERFAYVVSHDLQAPLRTIASFSEMLQEDWKGRLDADADQLLGRIIAAVSRMRRLLLDLLAYSRVGTAQAEFEPTSLEAVFAAALEDLAAAVEESGAVITHDPLPTVTADPAQLEQLLSNLLGNALKFRSDEAPVIHVSARRERDVWLFGVRDNGIGIDPRYADAIFNVFERLHGANDYPGTGIGLAICKRIVERHRGRIWVDSRPNDGATFWFTLPA